MQDVVALGAGYLTLSHTWGANKNPAYSTRKHNVSERIEHGIAWRDLPLTFQNTIDAARRLRVPLIWIDNLCIVQDDSKEWVVESAKMGDIYKNSYLNISATSAKSSQEGLTSSLELHPRLLQTDWNGDRQAGCYRIMERSFWVDRISEASINTRGWVLQERVLASRILHYCYDQLAWECCELSASEQFPGGLPPPLQDTHGSFKQDVKIGLLTSFPNESSDEVTRRDAFVTWQTVVHMYGNCELSKPDQDKFVAISGLASAVQKQLNGDEYLAGIWRSNIYAGLLWKVFKERRHINEYTVDAGMYSKKYGTSARSSDYRAPSWSWASVDG
ncbi:heterokaryon incompatibility protein-domain-containing protein, partial [Massariosphaeria phaeospora]